MIGFIILVRILDIALLFCLVGVCLWLRYRW